MVKVKVNQIIPTATAIINAFAAHVEKSSDTEPRGVIEQADTLLASLFELRDNFHNKINTFGPKEPHKFLGGHEWSIRQRCFGDGYDSNNCGRWFLKVSTLYNITLMAEINLARSAPILPTRRDVASIKEHSWVTFPWNISALCSRTGRKC